MTAPATTQFTATVPRRDRRLPWGSGVTLFYKVLFANVAIVVLGAVAGTWITSAVVRNVHDGRFFPLILLFALAGIVLSVSVNYLAIRAAFRPLTELRRAASAVRGGDLDARADATAFEDPEIRQLAETLNSTLDNLARDREKLRSLASQVIRAQEDERRRIARELHDDTAQVLFAQLIRLTALKGSDDPTVHEVAASLEQMTSEALESVRRLALELRPPALDDLGLQEALGALAQRYSEQLGIPVDFQQRGPRGRLPSDLELVLYRVAQEALTNTAKHAGATSVWVDLDRTATEVVLSVRDDGRGFDLDKRFTSDDRGLGLGLFGMQERVDLVGGSFRVWSKPGRGSEVFAYIPLDPVGRAAPPPPTNGTARLHAD